MKRFKVVACHRVPALAASLATITLSALIGLGTAGPASAKAPNAWSCPASSAVDSFLAASNVGATYALTGTNEVTYTFYSLTNESPVGGVPGLVKFCVYASSKPTAVDAVATGANGADWTEANAKANFVFMRSGGNKTNIPLDGTSTLMGTADWSSTPPASQIILLHIADPAVCADIYGGTPSTCFVKPGNQDPDILLQICNAGPTPAYNAMPFGVVNCYKPNLGFEAQSVNEFGDEVGLAGTLTQLDKLQVLFSSYACSVSGHWNTGDCVTAAGNPTFTHSITANIYDADDSRRGWGVHQPAGHNRYAPVPVGLGRLHAARRDHFEVGAELGAA